MSKTAPSFEAKKPLPLPKFPSSTWRWEPGAVPFLPLQTIPGSADHLPWPWEQTNPWLGKLPQLIFCWATPKTPLSTAWVANVSMFLYQSDSLNSKVSQKQNTKHFSPSFLSHKSFQGPPCQKGIILNSPSWHIRYSKIISVASSEHCQISLKAN